MKTLGFLVAVSCAATGLAGCRKPPDDGKPSPTPSAAAASATPVPSAEPGASPSSAGPAASAEGGEAAALMLPTRACRAITVKGHVTTERGTEMKSGDPIDRSEWLTLAKGASLAVKHAETARELVFQGPARVVACDRGEERFLMTEGRVETATWAGARPGAEVLVLTPFGAVVYGDAKLVVTVTRSGATLATDTGSAWVATPKPGNDPEERKIQGGARAQLNGPMQEVKSLVHDCEGRAEASEKLARAVLDGASKVPLGERAAAHARARKAARLACGIAAAGLGTVENGPDREKLAEAVGRAESRYRSVPSLTPH